MITKKEKVLLDRLEGAVFGFAIGDAMGATTEFMTDVNIRKQYGQVTNIIGGGWLKLLPGEVTDDTQMMTCITEALLTCYDDGNYPEDDFLFQQIKENFIRWYLSNPPDIGNQCRKGIVGLMRGLRMPQDNQALGNGALMRALPFALLDMKQNNVRQCKLTHNNVMCTSTISRYEQMIQSYLHGYYNKQKVNGLLEPSGHVMNTYNNALYWSNNFSFADAIIGAVNHGGDADTIAAITGSLSGAKWGINCIPKQWLDKLDPKVVIQLNNFIKFAFTYIQNK